MKHKRSLAWLLIVAMSVGVLATAALAADTDAQSQATQKTDSAQAEKPQMKPGTDSIQDGEAQGKGRKCGKKEEAAEPEGAIGKDRAGQIALADAGLSADQAGKVRVRVSDSDGTAVYKVRFTCDGQRYSYRIDAMSGEILDQKVRADDGEARHGRGQKTKEASDEQGQNV